MQCAEAATHLGLAPPHEVGPFARRNQVAHYLGVGHFFK